MPVHIRAKRWPVHALPRNYYRVRHTPPAEATTAWPALFPAALASRDRAASPAGPAHGDLSRRSRTLMLTVTPGAAAALLVPLSPAACADHGWLVSESERRAQAALARRIRRRRSEERSSSFRPPQVPYFSGLLTA